MKLRFECDEDWDAMQGDDRRRRHALDAAGATDRLLAWAAVAAVPMLAVGLGASEVPERSAAGHGQGPQASFGSPSGPAGMRAAIDDALAVALEAKPGPVRIAAAEVEPHPPLAAGPEPTVAVRRRMGKPVLHRKAMGEPARPALMK